MHNHLLETLGRGLALDTATLLIRWLNEYGYTLLRTEEPGARIWLADAVEDLLQGRCEAAAQRARSQLAAGPESTAGHMILAAASLVENRVSQAAESLQTICHRRPDHTLALYALGHCSERLGDESQAVACYQDTLKLRGFLHLPLLRLAAIHVKNLQYESALDQYLALRQIDPEAMPVHTSLGHLFIATGQTRQAVQAFENAILMNPDALAWQDPEIDLLIETDQLDQALCALEHSLEQFPARPDLLTRHADVLSLLDDTDNAIARYREAVEACPNYLEAAVKLAAHLERQEAFHEAAKYYNRALEISEQTISAYIGLAISYNLAGGIQNALAALCSASMLQPNASLLLVQTARMLTLDVSGPGSHHTRDDPQAAPTLLQRALHTRLSTNPHDPMALYAASVLACYAQQHATALNHLKTAIQVHPDSHRLNDKLILSHYALGDNHQAIHALTTESRRPGQTPMDLYYRTAVLYCSRPRFAASMLNLDRHLADNLARTDPAVHIRVILQDLGVLDREEVMLEWLQETLSPCMSGAGQDVP